MACPHFGTCITHPGTTRQAQDEHHRTKTICFHKLEVGTVFYTHTTSRSGLSKRHLTISVYSSVIYHAFYEEYCARLGRRDEKGALSACQLDGLGEEGAWIRVLELTSTSDGEGGAKQGTRPCKRAGWLMDLLATARGGVFPFSHMKIFGTLSRILITSLTSK